MPSFLDLIYIDKMEWLNKNKKPKKEFLPEPPSKSDRAKYQIVQESSLDSTALSPAGAFGWAQIMPATHEDYVKATGDKSSFRRLSNFNQAMKERNWYMDKINSLDFLKDKPGLPIVKLAKAYATYNAGPGPIVNALNQAKAEGEDIYNSLKWLDRVPKESKGYVENILLKNPTFMNKYKENLKKPNAKFLNRIKFQTGGKMSKERQWLQRDINKTPEEKVISSHAYPGFAQGRMDEAWNTINTIGGLTPAFPLVMANEAGRQIDKGEYLNAGITGALAAAPYALGAGIKAASHYIKAGVNNIYKINPFAEKLVNKNASFRVAGEDAYKDFIESGVLRSGLGDPVSIGEKIVYRTTPFPSFQKGYADLKRYSNPSMKNYVFKTNVPTFKRGEANPVTGNIIKGSHYAHRPINMETGEIINSLPAKDVQVFNTIPNWLMGYKQIK